MNEIKKYLGTDKLVIGKDKTMKALSNGKVEKVILASNAPKDLVSDIDYYKKLGGFEVVTTKFSNDELGTFCKKSFSISVLAILKQ